MLPTSRPAVTSSLSWWLSIAIAVASAALLSSCVRVKPYQRELLSKPCMAQDELPLVGKQAAHMQEYREGSIGGTGVGVGGCGCN